MNPVTRAIEKIGLIALARELGISYQSVKKWEMRGMPRTEWTGETHYAEKIEVITQGTVTKSDLLKTKGKQ